MSSSVSNISIRYHAEDEQLEELYEIDTRFGKICISAYAYEWI